MCGTTNLFPFFLDGLTFFPCSTQVDEIEKEMDSVVDSVIEKVKKERSLRKNSVRGDDVNRKQK